MTLDGTTVLRPGMTAQGWYTEDGEQVESAEVVAVGADGSPLPAHPSTIGVEQPLEGPVSPTAVLDLAVDSVLMLTPRSIPDGLRLALEQGSVFRFAYCYRPDPAPSTAFLVGNPSGFFALIGRPVQVQWMSRDLALHEAPTGAADDEDLDFEMV